MMMISFHLLALFGLEMARKSFPKWGSLIVAYIEQFGLCRDIQSSYPSVYELRIPHRRSLSSPKIARKPPCS